MKVNDTRVSSDSSRTVCAVNWAPHICQAYCMAAYLLFSHILFIMTRCIFRGMKRFMLLLMSFFFFFACLLPNKCKYSKSTQVNSNRCCALGVILVGWPLLGRFPTIPYFCHLWIQAISLLRRVVGVIRPGCGSRNWTLVC